MELVRQVDLLDLTGALRSWGLTDFGRLRRLMGAAGSKGLEAVKCRPLGVGKWLPFSWNDRFVNRPDGERTMAGATVDAYGMTDKRNKQRLEFIG